MSSAVATMGMASALATRANHAIRATSGSRCCSGSLSRKNCCTSITTRQLRSRSKRGCEQATASVSHPFTTVMHMSPQHWQVERVLAWAPRPSSVAAAQPLAVPARWSSTGYDARLVWGRCTGTSAEPYEYAVEHAAAAFRCSCPSRVLPCKHVLALLLLWAQGHVAEGQPPA